MMSKWVACVAFWCGVSSVACSGPKQAEGPSGGAELGHSPEAPVVTCGPAESYEYVASRFRCADGTNPLGGDVERARAARRGSRPSPVNNHVIDVYDVPCQGGSVAVYVDLYGCEEYARKLTQTQQGTREGEELLGTFHAGDFDSVLARCRNLPQGGPADVSAWCRALIPASLYAQKRDNEGLGALSASCQQLHVASSDSDARATQLAMTVIALASLAQKGKYESDEAQRSAMIESWLNACEVPGAQLEQVLESYQK